MLLPICMEPMFEGLLVQNEQAVRRALGLVNLPSPQGWPKSGWGTGQLKPDAGLLIPAIAAMTRNRPKHEVTKKIRGDFRTNKDGWGEFLLRKMLDDNEARPLILSHPIYERLRAWLAQE